MNPKRALIAIIVLALALSACNLFDDEIEGSGKVVTEDRSVSDFTAIDLSGIGTLDVTFGDEETLEIEAEDNLIEHFETTVFNGTLDIGVEDDVQLKPTKPVLFHVTMQALDSVRISGSGDVIAPDLAAGDFRVAVSGSGDVTLAALTVDALEAAISGSGSIQVGNLTAARHDLNISGSGSMTIAGGEVDEQDIQISGSGRYRGGDLSSGTVEVSVSGSGSVTVWAADSLDVNVAGSGSVEYYGEPATSFSSSGSGSINRLGPHE